MGELIRRRILAINLIAQPPGNNGRVIEVASNHLAQLLQSIFQNVPVGLSAHAIERVWPPGRNFGLYQDAVAVAIIQHPLVLRPVHTGEYAIQMFHVLMVMSDPFGWFCHPELWIAPGHAFHAHKAHPLAIQVKSTVYYVELPYTKTSSEAVT